MGASESRSAGQQLWDACQNGDDSTVTEALQNPQVSLILEWKHPRRGTTPLMAACRSGRRNIAEKLLDHGALIDAKDSGIHQNTALHYAAYKDRSLVVQLLLDRGCDPFVWNGKGHSALDLSRFQGSEASASVIVERFALVKNWLYIKKSAVVPSWQRKWCLLLPASRSSEIMELAIYSGIHICRPEKIILYHRSAITAVPIDKLRWHDKRHMFGFRDKVEVLKFGTCTFSRDDRRRTQVGPLLRVIFASEDAYATSKWLNTIQSTCNRPNLLVAPHEPPPSYEETTARRLTEPPSYISLSNRTCISCGSSSCTSPCAQVQRSPVTPSPTLSPLFPVALSTLPPPSPIAPIIADDAALPSAPPLSAARYSNVEDDNESELNIKLAKECVICMDNARNAVCVPCGHISACFDCLTNVSTGCPICRADITTVVRIYNV